jgi:hypothetical protein
MMSIYYTDIVDIKPKNMEELTEVITSVRLHPVNCNILAYSTSRGVIKVGDTRAAALCDRGAKVLEVPEDLASKSFFSEIISSISDIKYVTISPTSLSCFPLLPLYFLLLPPLFNSSLLAPPLLLAPRLFSLRQFRK